MLRTLGVLLLSLATAATGFIVNDKYKQRFTVLDELCRFSAVLTDEMRSRHNGLFEIFVRHGKGRLEFLSRINKDNIGCTEKLVSVLINCHIDKSDAPVIADFLTGLGVGDITVQEDHCRYYSEKFSQLRSESKAQIADKGRLLKSLFMFAGAAVFIIFI